MLKIFALVISVCFPQLDGECHLLRTEYLPVFMTDSECRSLIDLEKQALEKEYDVKIEYAYCLPLQADMYVKDMIAD